MKRMFIILFVWAIAGYIEAAGVSDKELKLIADAVNKKAPVMVDQETRLVGATGANNTLTYRYTMINYTVAQLNKEKFTSIIKTQLIKVSCPKIKVMLDAGITAVYSYSDKNGALISAVSLDSKVCK